MPDVYEAIAAIAEAAESQSQPVSAADVFTATSTRRDRMITVMVENVFEIAQRGVVATGTVVGGTLTTGMSLRVERANGDDLVSTCEAIERGRELLPSASDGETVGVLLAGLTTEDIESGDRLITD